MESQSMCDDTGFIKHFNLTNNNLRAINPKHLTKIGYFKLLDLSHNAIGGGMASVAGHAIEMQVLDLSYNQLGGQIRGGGGMQPLPLRSFRLDGNQLLGMNPFICMLMPHLEVLSVLGNPLGTQLGAGYAACKNMTRFVLANTAIKGQIPREFGSLQKLTEFNISGNPKINGTIPMELSFLPSLNVLDISGTAITGTIPQLLCDREEEGLLEIAANCSMVKCCSSTH